jgi:hypothetical protein
LQKLSERLRLMSDEELVKFGKMVRGLSTPRVSVTPDPWKAPQRAKPEWVGTYTVDCSEVNLGKCATNSFASLALDGIREMNEK